jgi:hypothetical protein
LVFANTFTIVHARSSIEPIMAFLVKQHLGVILSSTHARARAIFSFLAASIVLWMNRGSGGTGGLGKE